MSLPASVRERLKDQADAICRGIPGREGKLDAEAQKLAQVRRQLEADRQALADMEAVLAEDDVARGEVEADREVVVSNRKAKRR